MKQMHHFDYGDKFLLQTYGYSGYFRLCQQAAPDVVGITADIQNSKAADRQPQIIRDPVKKYIFILI